MTVDIIIKSFNRPYYLERCIRSIYKFVKGDFRIKILDDGTAPRYLFRISSTFPEISICHSPLSEEKWKAIKEHVEKGGELNSLVIPTSFWIEHISNASDYFLLLEDDIWITEELLIDEVVHLMKREQLVKVKISWQGSEKVNQGEINPLGQGIEEIKPIISFRNEMILTNKFKSKSILHKMRLSKASFNALLPFYSIYAVASAFFEKEYWLYLWQGAGDRVNENYQLKKAFFWYKSRKGRYGKMENEKARTSYITSATNSFPETLFSMFHFNYHLNEAWLAGEFDAMENFPLDFNEEYIKSFLNRANDKNCTYEGWRAWSKKFKRMYKDIGCLVD